MGGKDLVPPASQIYSGSGSLIIKDGGVLAIARQWLIRIWRCHHFLNPFSLWQALFYVGLSAEIRTKKTIAFRVQVLLSLSYLPFSEGETYGRQVPLSSLAGARENLKRSNLVGDMKKPDKFVKGQLFNLQRTWQQSVSHIWILQVVA